MTDITTAAEFSNTLAKTGKPKVTHSLKRAKTKSADKSAQPAAALPTNPASPPKPERFTRADQLRAALQAADGASISDLCARFGWLPHSARAAMTGLRKRGLEVQRSKVGAVTLYRIASA